MEKGEEKTEAMIMKFKTISCDPPWHFNDRLDSTRRKPYETLTFEELLELPVEKVADDNCHLYLWCPNTLILRGATLMETYGFSLKTVITWVKLTAKGKLWFGMGHYFRSCTESLLFGVKGKLRCSTKNTRNLICAKKPKIHSGKPEESYQLIELNSPEPRLEMFAREEREDWTCIGSEIDGKDIRTSLQQLMELEPK